MIQAVRPTRREMEEAYARLAGASTRQQVVRALGWAMAVSTLVLSALAMGYWFSSL
jgi:hypothetical protein